MKKLGKILSVLLSCIFGISFIVACSPEDPGGVSGSSDLVKVTQNQVIAANDHFRVVMDKKTGYIQTVKNLTTGTVHKDSDKGSWPFYIEYSEDEGSSIYTSSINKDTKNTVKAIDISEKDGTTYLKMTFDSLKTDSKSSSKDTGIGASVTYNFTKDSQYFKFTVSLDMKNAKGDCMALHLLNGGGLRSGGGADEYLVAPVWGTGTKWQNPIYNSNFMLGKTLAYPGLNDQSLEMGWMDLYGEENGIGIGYIDKSEMLTEFRVKSDGGGMGIEIVLFHPQQVYGEYVPLPKGYPQVYTTDEAFVAIHEGQWHTVGDIYSAEFNKAFTLEDGTPDYMTLEKKTDKQSNALSTIADTTDYFFRMIGTVPGEGTMGNAEDFNTIVQTHAEKLGARLENSMLWTVGITEHGYGNDQPFLMPLNTNLDNSTGEKTAEGALNTWKTYLADETSEGSYRNEGGRMMLYSHPFVYDADETHTNQRFEHYEDILPSKPYYSSWYGGKSVSACVYNEYVEDLWKDELLPSYRLLGGDGCQFDQGSLVQSVCDREGHLHSATDPVERLSAGVKGIVNLSKIVKSEEGLGENAFILSEATNDLTCRYIDIRQDHWLEHPPMWGGEAEYGLTAYCFPEYVYSVLNFISNGAGVVEYYLQGAVWGGIMLLTDGPDSAQKLEYVRFANSQRDPQTQERLIPGYPHGFRDSLGLTNNNPSIFAKVYVEGNNVSVVYCTISAVADQKIQVDLDKLGFTGKGMKELAITADAQKIGYQTFTVE